VETLDQALRRNALSHAREEWRFRGESSLCSWPDANVTLDASFWPPAGRDKNPLFKAEALERRLLSPGRRLPLVMLFDTALRSQLAGTDVHFP